MKKALSLILTLALVILCLSACQNPNQKGGSITVVIESDPIAEYTVDFKPEDITNGLLSILDLLDIGYTESGGFLYTVDTLTLGDDEYIYIYTSESLDFDVSTYAKTMEYGGRSLTSAGVGAKNLHITDGALIYIGRIVW